MRAGLSVSISLSDIFPAVSGATRRTYATEKLPDSAGGFCSDIMAAGTAVAQIGERHPV
jgi:hypothetical protein